MVVVQALLVSRVHPRASRWERRKELFGVRLSEQLSATQLKILCRRCQALGFGHLLVREVLIKLHGQAITKTSRKASAPAPPTTSLLIQMAVYGLGNPMVRGRGPTTTARLVTIRDPEGQVADAERIEIVEEMTTVTDAASQSLQGEVTEEVCVD